MSNKTLHHFKHICFDKDAFGNVRTIKDFINVAQIQSPNQIYYSNPPDDPNRGRNKYFGDALESLVESMLQTLGNHKSINCTNYRPLDVDEFGNDGEGFFTRDNGSFGRQGVQIKNSSDPNHTYNASNSNIMSALGGCFADGYERLLFINTGAGISRSTLSRLTHRDSQLIVQLNRKDLEKLVDDNVIVWTNWFNSLFDI
jgi:hypothetical protein